MNKRRIALLAGLMTMGMVSFAMEEGMADVLKTQEQKELSIFNVNDRVRFDENRLEVNGNLHLDKNNRLELRVRSYSNISDTFGSETGDGTGKGESTGRTELRMRLHTQTSVENMEVRTELKTNTYDGKDGTQYFRVQPTWHLFNDVEGLSSLVRAGLGMNHTSGSGEDFSFTSSFENYYTINDYLAVEGNVYYDYTFARNRNKYNNVDIEAYVYANYPLYNAEGIKVEALFSGGADPYSFGARDFDNLNNVTKDDEGEESYVLYAEPSVKATKTLNETNSVFLQAGYYIEMTEANDKTSDTGAWKGSSDKYNDTGFVRVGFTSKY
ncbi:hypothetical protein [Psychrilyobacter sp.]|uniref:FomA family porin-like outer membrane protein n=1 Tax=Psychrilyobacter sp. TaxID=2586924 RepID=UPI00301A3C8F